VPGSSIRVAMLNGWYGGGTALDVAVETPGGASTPFQAVTSGPGATATYTLPGARVRISTPPVNPGNGDMRFVVEVFGPGTGTAVAGGTWRLKLRHASGPATDAHAWALDDTGGSVFFTGAGVAHSMKIGSPGSSAEAVTVASYTTKVQWNDNSGTPRSTPMPLNDISPFSSDGPLRNGAKKPDLAAPGAMIAAALSSGSSPQAAFVLSSGFRVNAGTSMATPFVSGLVALLLERDKTLDPAGLKTLLSGHCRVPNQAPGAFHQKWGLGLIDAMML
jgi:subtilisin family serine protease